MSLTELDIKKVANLAKLSLSDQEITASHQQLTNILKLVDEMSQIDTTSIAPLAHPLDISQRLRPDEVTETNERDLLLKGAPDTEAGLFLVPKVINHATS